ncbi:hypothetical protein SNE40_017708 [Patella caerulea]|uniref:Uncharacterized protein n=1 Tax=Patella caerulea TaxID=87958 RepID=A0AAN8PME5_PATCE
MASTPKGKDTTPIHDAPILTKPTPKALRPSELSTTPIPNVSRSLDTDDTTVKAMTTTSENLSKAYSNVSPVSEVTRKSTPGAQRSSMLESKVRSDETVFTTTKSNDLVSSRDPLPSTIRNNPPFSEALTADITETTSPKNTDLVSPGDAIFFNGSSYCECFCRAVYQTADMAEFIAEVKAEIKKNLTVATEQLTSTIRKKTSATDERPSAVYTGYIGIVLIILSLGSLILSDLISLITFVYHRVQVLFNNA